jgi:signal peptidase II
VHGVQAARGTALSEGAAELESDVTRLHVAELALVAVTVLAGDIVTKRLAVDHLGDGAKELFGGALTLHLTRNSGAAFGMAQGMTVLFSLVAAIVVVFIVRIARRLRSTGWAVALGLILGGATGNLTDRIFRSPGPFRGQVIDFLELPHWPIFNLADSAIVSGGALIVLMSARGITYDGRRDDGGEPGQARDPA